MKPRTQRLKSYTVELEYLLPVYQTVVVQVPAGTPVEKVCELAQEKGEKWKGGGTSDYDGSSATYVSAMVRGAHEHCYGDRMRAVRIPPRHGQRKVLIEDLLGVSMKKLASALGALCAPRCSREARRRGKAALRGMGIVA